MGVSKNQVSQLEGFSKQLTAFQGFNGGAILSACATHLSRVLAKSVFFFKKKRKKKKKLFWRTLKSTQYETDGRLFYSKTADGVTVQQTSGPLLEGTRERIKLSGEQM